MHSSLKYIIPAIIFVIIMIVAEASKPVELDWRQSYSETMKTPYGGFIIRDLLTDIFPNQYIESVYESPFEWIYPEGYADYNVLIITRYFEPDEFETEKLLQAASNGATIFIAAEIIQGPIADSLNLITSTAVPSVELNPDTAGLGSVLYDSLSLNFVNPRLKRDTSYAYPNFSVNQYFSKVDTSETIVLGNNTADAAVFIKVPMGNGQLLLSTVPNAFTNYNAVTGDNWEYIYKAFSYIPQQTVYWDEHYKDVQFRREDSPMRYILGESSLRSAFYLALLTIVLFFFFQGRRRQRVIPYQERPQNSTLEFVTTISRLHLQHGDYLQIAQKQVKHFLDYLKTKFKLKTISYDEEFILQLSKRSRIERRTVAALFRQIQKANYESDFSAEDLLKLNAQIEEFQERAD